MRKKVDKKHYKSFEAVNFPGHFIGINEEGELQIMEKTFNEEADTKNFVFKTVGSIKKKCLKESHEKGLTDEKSIWSSCHTFEARMQGDGNFVIYKWTEGDASPIWASDTCNSGEGPFKLAMQGDGNLVVYDSTGAAKWASNTCGTGTGPYKLKMQTDGNMVIYDGEKAAIWASGTDGK